jgi:D-beta-D-heptose 7-phosphate kinase / D-beta-D-heptose 1-phosphate adenosyltransferase
VTRDAGEGMGASGGRGTAVTVVGDVLLEDGGTMPGAGGAGLVALLLARDGHDVTLVTALSGDEAAARLAAALGGVRVVASRPGQPEGTEEMLTAVREAPVLLVADRGHGLTDHEEVRRALAEAARSVPVVWDPHPRGAAPVPGTRVVTPDLEQARAAARVSLSGVAAADEAARILLTAWSTEAVVVTMGEQGALLRTNLDGLPSVAWSPVAAGAADAYGASDRFAASLTIAVAAGAQLPEAVLTAVTEASAFLAAGGVSAVQGPAGAAPQPGADRDAIAVAERVRAAGGIVVATGGCFDLLHVGHARTLSAARALGDCLIVLLNSDDSVRRLKGADRPILPEEDRVDLLLALQCVDGVLVFGEDTPVDAIRRIRPDLWVKGGDYVATDLPEASVIKEWGGRAVTVPFHPGRSTTRLAAALARLG